MSDAAYDRIRSYAEAQGLELYPHQEEAILELLSGSNVVLATPTGSGDSLVATAAHMAAMAESRESFYSAPIKALVSEKFFALCEVFGAQDVEVLTGLSRLAALAPQPPGRGSRRMSRPAGIVRRVHKNRPPRGVRP